MKPTFLALLIAAGAFGASTIYLAVQLDEERAQADRFIAESRVLNARIAELEKSRTELEQSRQAGAGAVSNDAQGSAGGKPATAPDPVLAPASATREVPVEAGDRPGPAMPQASEAMQKMRRTQLRANNKRLHADIGEKLGLSNDEAGKLIDLITDQQMAAMHRGRGERVADGSGDRRATSHEMNQQKNLAEITALIGADKAELYKAYQETMPARQEVNMLERQLEGIDSTLSKDQRDRMITALADERKRIPEPRFADSASREEHAKASLDWQQDYQERAATRARSILSSEQFATYNEYQQWTREMRQQYEARRAARGSGAPAGAPGSAPPPREP
jgi:hypothetical protein